MARRRGRRRKRRPMRRSQNRSFRPDIILSGRGRLTPDSTQPFGVDALPDGIKPPFRVRWVELTFSAVDVATANAQTIGPALVQIRQLGYLPSTTAATDGETIKSSLPVMTTMSTVKRVRFRTRPIVYPAHYTGTSFIAFDCLCFKSGSEIGIDYSYRIAFQKIRSFQPEACPKLADPVPLYYADSRPSTSLGDHSPFDCI